FYSKKRKYQNTEFEEKETRDAEMAKRLTMTHKEWAVLAGSVVAFSIQLYTNSLPLGALIGLVIMIAFEGIEYKKV
ncbi:sodium:proton antiporter, partial [Campylobacter sp. MOP51]